MVDLQLFVLAELFQSLVPLLRHHHVIDIFSKDFYSHAEEKSIDLHLVVSNFVPCNHCVPA